MQERWKYNLVLVSSGHVCCLTLSGTDGCSKVNFLSVLQMLRSLLETPSGYAP